MATSAVAICNLALSRMGNGQAIASLTERSTQALQLNAIYESARDDLLRAVWWGFAKRVVPLQLVANSPTPEWLYSYQVPADCLNARRILPPTGRAAVADVPFEVLGSDTGMLLLADVANPYLEYTTRVTNEALFTSDFVSVFAWRLAKDSVIALSVSPAFAQRIDGSYAMELASAQAAVRRERRDDPQAESSFITSRT